MNGAQDLGGMMSFGPVVAEPNEPVFHAAWEKRAMAMMLAMGAAGRWNIDASRYARETLHPAVYLTSSYYEIWLAGLERLVVQAGLVGAGEIAAGRADGPGEPVRVLTAGAVARVLAAGTPYSRPAPQPSRFAAGARVRTKVMNPTTHTRLPRYARGKTGIVDAVRGCFVFPDTNAHGLGEQPQWCYAIRFDGRELWGPDSDPAVSVAIDAFEPYLEPADARG